MLEPYERELMDDFGGVDELVEVKRALLPGDAERDPTVEQIHTLVLIIEPGDLTYLPYPLPRFTPANDVEIIGCLNDPPHNERPTPKDGVITDRQRQRPNHIKKLITQ